MGQIYPATIADLEQLVALENKLFISDRIPRRQFRYLLTKANGITVKIEQDGTLTGYMILLQRRNSSNLRIYSIAISSEAQGCGHARELVKFAEETAAKNKLRHVSLEVCEHNIAALQLYASSGFYRYGLKPNYYEDGCTALLLRKDIVHKDIHK